ncbi:MAG: hypothetical protein WC372_10610 [Candidatus Neomarinimicrobiota bacterium]|jgi:hypothetical protein
METLGEENLRKPQGKEFSYLFDGGWSQLGAPAIPVVHALGYKPAIIWLVVPVVIDSVNM